MIVDVCTLELLLRGTSAAPLSKRFTNACIQQEFPLELYSLPVDLDLTGLHKVLGNEASIIAGIGFYENHSFQT